MGQYFQPGMETLPGTQPSDFSQSQFFQNFLRQQAPQTQAPTPQATNQAIAQQQEVIGQTAPQMAQMYSQLMQGGGRPEVSGIMDTQARQYQNQLDQIRAQGGTMPLGSARDRYFGQALGQATGQYNLAQQQILLNQAQQAIQNQLAGAQGLAGVPSLYAQPSALELQMLGMRQPYDLANQQAMMSMAGLQGQMMMPMVQPTPIDYMQTPSQFEQQFGWLSPFLQAGGQAAGAALPTLLK